MFLFKYVREYELIPRGYRIAWRDWRRNQGVCLPFGIHLIAIVIRRVWIWTYVYPRPDWLERHDVEIALEAKKQEREYQERLRKHENDYGTSQEQAVYQKGYDAGWNAHRVYRDLRDKIEGSGKKENGPGHVPATGEAGSAERGLQPERDGVEQACPDAEVDRS